jgi:hypothetical protein
MLLLYGYFAHKGLHIGAPGFKYVLLIAGQRHRRQNANDCYRDHQFNQSEACVFCTLGHISIHFLTISQIVFVI